ncbi:MAG: nitroreductase family protein [Actinomadura sp.]
MEFTDVLRRRRMTRRYRPDPVSPETVERIVRVVRRAPSAGFSQGHRLIVVTDAATRERIADIAEESWYVERGMPKWLSVAPVLIVLGVSEADYHARYTQPDKLEDGAEITWPAPYWWVDAGAFLMLIQLTAIDAGLATGFVTVRRTDRLREFLGIPDDIAIVGLVTIGHSAEDDEEVAEFADRMRSRRKPLDELVRYETWSPPA